MDIFASVIEFESVCIPIPLISGIKMLLDISTVIAGKLKDPYFTIKHSESSESRQLKRDQSVTVAVEMITPRPSHTNVVSPTFSQLEAVEATQSAQLVMISNDFLEVPTTRRERLEMIDRLELRRLKLQRQHERSLRLLSSNRRGRNNRYVRDNIQNITNSDIRRLARRGGVKRISGGIYEEVRGSLKVHLSKIIDIATTYTEHARRKTVTAMDIVHALKHMDRTLYGFGG
jgi:histone H4